MRFVALVLLLGCSSDKATAPAEPAPSPVQAAPRTSAPGTGSVRGLVTFADKPVGGITVSLCKTLGSIAGCNDVVAKTTTGADGTYVFKDVPVGTYGGTAAQVFETDRYVFMSKVVAMTGAGVEVTDGGVVEVSPLGLFKDDLALIAPKANAKVAPTNLVLQWAAVPEAASYTVYLGEVTEGAKDAFDLKETATTPSFTVPGPLRPGRYSFNVDARSAKGDLVSVGTSRVFVVR